MAGNFERLAIDAIEIGPRLRPVDGEAVASLAKSIERLGLQTPITVRADPGDYSRVVLVAGFHRLEACKRLGHDEIDCFVVEDDNQDRARMWEIAENLHRAELTVLQRSEHIAEWIRLADRVLLQVETKPQGGRPQSGVRAAARELKIESTEAHRAAKVASLTDEAKQAASAAGLDDNQSALLRVARAAPDKQAAIVREIMEERAITKHDPPNMNAVAWQLGKKYSLTELQELVDHLCDLIKERSA